eukprot:3936712-Rhodomonas_salina.1
MQSPFQTLHHLVTTRHVRLNGERPQQTQGVRHEEGITMLFQRSSLRWGSVPFLRFPLAGVLLFFELLTAQCEEGVSRESERDKDAGSCQYRQALSGQHCFGLIQADVSTTLQCEQLCCERGECDMWLFSTDHGCWLGDDHNQYRCIASTHPWEGATTMSSYTFACDPRY